ncbi:MAG: hypothetical protein M3P83_05690 [Actinomycetota bacterium]|nr:hypothetical protein [Actinomycetota bacterium]
MPISRRVRDRLETQVVPQVRHALDAPTLPVDIQLRPEKGRETGRGLH